MSEKREIIGHSRHSIQKPHMLVPGGFTPLKLWIEAQQMEIDVLCPLATVGRHTETDLRLAYADISRKHCQFAYETGIWRVQDLHSLNGVFVNNVRAAESTLYAGDHVRIGSITFLILSATPLREERHDKLRQIVNVLPTEVSI